jgi:hypothetical protein
MPLRLFNEIDAVSWGKLHHAYGPATDVPDLLRALMTPEAASADLREAAQKNKRNVFEQVSWELWGNVFHQGSVWQVTAETVPFLAAILRDGPDNVECKVFLIDYLHHLAMGYPQDLFPDLPNPDEAFATIAGLCDLGGEPDYNTDDKRPLIWMRDSYEAVERHIDVVLPYLDNSDLRVAYAAIALCGSFPRCTDRSVPLLRRLASTGGHRGATAAVSMAVLGALETRSIAESIARSPDRLTALLGACAAVLADADGISTNIVTTLTMPLEAFAQTESAHASTVSNLVGRSLARLGPEYRDRAATGICRQLAVASPLEALSLTHSLLVLAFETQQSRHASGLSTTQRAALEAIRDHGAFKVVDGIFANYANLLAGWGLPESAEGIESLLRSG